MVKGNRLRFFMVENGKKIKEISKSDATKMKELFKARAENNEVLYNLSKLRESKQFQPNEKPVKHTFRFVVHQNGKNRKEIYRGDARTLKELFKAKHISKTNTIMYNLSKPIGSRGRGNTGKLQHSLGKLADAYKRESGEDAEIVHISTWDADGRPIVFNVPIFLLDRANVSNRGIILSPVGKNGTMLFLALVIEDFMKKCNYVDILKSGFLLESDLLFHHREFLKNPASHEAVLVAQRIGYPFVDLVDVYMLSRPMTGEDSVDRHFTPDVDNRELTQKIFGVTL